ncbi:MAG: hypothetical protein IJB52_06790 [Clostridia bacterium]|nr:hypothetical protein [Clostridia bacterium]
MSFFRDRAAADRFRCVGQKRKPMLWLLPFCIGIPFQTKPNCPCFCLSTMEHAGQKPEETDVC